MPTRNGTPEETVFSSETTIFRCISVLISNDPEKEEQITDEVYTFAGKAEEGDFKMSIGSTYAPHSTLLTVTSDDDWSEDQPEGYEESEEDYWDEI
jgi:hypothetical protein